MKKQKKEIFRRLIERAKKDASVFLNSEEGKILKKDIVKTALTLGMVVAPIDAAFGHSSHASGPHANHGGGHSHTNHYSSHSSHVNTHTNIPHSDTPHSNGAHVDSMQVSLHNDVGASGLIGGHSDSAHNDSAHNDIGHNDSHSNY